MNQKIMAVSTFVLTTCALMSACTTLDSFTIHNIDNGYEERASLDKQELVLKEPCKYVAGAEIVGHLSPGPLQPDAIGTPAPSNSHIKEAIFLINVGDVEAGGAEIASYIGVRKDGAFIRNVILHKDRPVATPLAGESAKIRFTPENCHYSMEAVKQHRKNTG